MYPQRNIGLDIIRSLAIILVIICHSTLFLTGINTALLKYVGILSVELFFVLSGYLIGQSLVSSIVEDNSLKSLKIFYTKRLLRTLPLYYLTLIITSLTLKQPVPFSHFLFIQNFNESDLNFMPVSWSLSVEEWFYFIAPITLFLTTKYFTRKFSKKEIFFVSSFILCIIPFALRTYSVIANNLSWDFGVRKQIFFRMDAIMMGVILAGIKIYSPQLYRKISKENLSLLLSCSGFILLGIFFSCYLGKYDNFNQSNFWKIFLFSILPLLSCFLVIYMENNCEINDFLLHPIIVKWFSKLSTLSYGLYLIHWYIFSQFCTHHRGMWALIISTIISIIIAEIAYRYVETPIMNLRDKIIAHL